jgi:hypothetical protein
MFSWGNVRSLIVSEDLDLLGKKAVSDTTLIISTLLGSV